MVKPGVRIINAARGGLVDEQALADAIAEGRVAGAGIDVFARSRAPRRRCSRSTTWWPPRTWAPRPIEAQDKAGLAVARSVKLALQGEFVPDAVNVQAGGVVAEDVRPLLPLAEKLGRVFTAVAGGIAAAVTVEVRGEVVAHDVSRAQAGRHQGPVRLAWSRSRSPTSTRRTWPPTAASRSPWPRCTETVDHPNLVTVRGALPDGRVASVSGTYRPAPGEALQADRAGRLRPRARRRGRAAVLPLRRPARRGRHDRHPARRGRASTSPPCRWPGARPAARR